jgi:hypothetical protein
MTTRFARVGAGIGAALFAVWFGLRLSDIRPLFAVFAPGPAGVGAVSMGITANPVLEALIFMAAIAANRVIARWTQRSAVLVRRLHLAHSGSLIAIPLVVLLWLAALVGGAFAPGGWMSLATVLSIAALFIGQMGIIAMLLAAYAWEPGRPVFARR